MVASVRVLGDGKNRVADKIRYVSRRSENGTARPFQDLLTITFFGTRPILFPPATSFGAFRVSDRVLVFTQYVHSIGPQTGSILSD